MTKHIRRRHNPERHWTWLRILTVVAVIAFVTWALVKHSCERSGPSRSK